MNRPRNGHDYAGIVAVILAVTLCLVLLFTGFAIVVLDRDIGESAQRLLTTIGAGLVGALATYVGTSGRRRGGDGGGEDRE
jgi:type VI protein secretion system component VasK